MLRKWCLEMAFNTDMESYWNRFVAVKQESPTPNSVYVDGGALRCVAEPRMVCLYMTNITCNTGHDWSKGLAQQNFRD